MYISLEDARKLAKERPEVIQEYCVSRTIDMLKFSGECIINGETARTALLGYMANFNLTEADVEWCESSSGVPYLRVKNDDARPYRIPYLHPPEMNVVIYAF